MNYRLDRDAERFDMERREREEFRRQAEAVTVQRRGKAVTASFSPDVPLSVAHRAMGSALIAFDHARVKVAPKRAMGSNAPFFILASDDSEDSLRDVVLAASVNALRKVA